METERLIHQLADRPAPVRRLPPPWHRAAVWLAISLPYVIAVTFAHPMQIELSGLLTDRQFVVEQLATLATAVTAVLAAFCSVIPGYNRKVLLIPLLPLAVWLASLGDGCIRDWIRLGSDGLSLRADWSCLLPASVIGVVPALVIVIMLRRGAPLFPHATMAMAALAVAALGNFGLRAFHLGDESIMILVWHFGGAIALSLLVGWIGKLILKWKGVRASAAS